MEIYKVSQTDNNSYDTYDSFVCYAEDKEQASKMLPDSKYATWYTPPKEGETYGRGEWAISPETVTVVHLGTTYDDVAPSVILASFNAG